MNYPKILRMSKEQEAKNNDLLLEIRDQNQNLGGII
jgi:hypothetical protein